MTEDPSYSNIHPPEHFSTGGPQWTNPAVTSASASKKELIDVWFIDPLRRMDGHQAFVCLSNCLFLYEKYLKMTDQIGQNVKFTKGHKVFNQMGKDFGITADDAYEFWECWRNGLAHHGMPKISEKYQWGMTGEQKELVLIEGNIFTINPWLIRDKILNKIEHKKSIWDDELAPLMNIFRISNP